MVGHTFLASLRLVAMASILMGLGIFYAVPAILMGMLVKKARGSVGT